MTDHGIILIMNAYFADNKYDTPLNTDRHWLDRVMLRSRFALHTHFIWEIIKASWLAEKNRYDRLAWARTAYNIFKMVEGCNGRFHINGLDTVRNLKSPVVFIGNHMSSIENNIFGCLLPLHQEINFVVKESLTRYPVFRQMVIALNPIAVGRTNPRADLQKVLTEGTARLQNGRSIFLFPQHTRTANFVPEAFNSLGIKLARRAVVPVVPVAVKTDFLENGRYLRDFGALNRDLPIHIAFGAPFNVANSKEAHRRVLDFIQHHLNLWQNQLPSSV